MPDITLTNSTRIAVTIPPRQSGWFNSSIPIYGSSVTSNDASRITPEALFEQLAAINPAYRQNLNRDTFVALISEGNTTLLRTRLQQAGVLSSHIDQFVGNEASGSHSATGCHLYHQERRVVEQHSNMSTGANYGCAVGVIGGLALTMAVVGAANFWNPAGWTMLGVAAGVGITLGVAVACTAIGSWLGSLF